MNGAAGSSSMLPLWADHELSHRLPELVSAGERQELEMKEHFPKQVRDLAKEIAAFATSNAGIVLVGVSNDGEIVGMSECETQADRARLVQRIEGICANIVKPTITPTVRFAVSGDRTVLAIDVPKGDAPLYYVGNVPYIRQLTAARPAEPQEVIDYVLAWHRARTGNEDASPEASFLSHVASLIVDVLVQGGELNERRVTPWLDYIRTDLAWSARDARDLAAEVPSVFEEMVTPLESLADQLELAAHERLSIDGGWEEMDTAAATAMDQARVIWTRWVGPHGIDINSVERLRETVAGTARKLSSLAARVDDMDKQGRLEEIQSTAGSCGLILLRAAAYGVGLGDEDSCAALTQIGRSLRKIETETVYVDGGKSAEHILDCVRQVNVDLNDWLVRSPIESNQ